MKIKLGAGLMTIHVDAIYEHGAFRPATPIILEEGVQVLLTIETEAPLRPPQGLAAALAEIAAMPAENPDDEFSGADHDTILYTGMRVKGNLLDRATGQWTTDART